MIWRPGYIWTRGEFTQPRSHSFAELCNLTSRLTDLGNLLMRMQHAHRTINQRHRRRRRRIFLFFQEGRGFPGNIPSPPRLEIGPDQTPPLLSTKSTPSRMYWLAAGKSHFSPLNHFSRWLIVNLAYGKRSFSYEFYPLFF